MTFLHISRSDILRNAGAIVRQYGGDATAVARLWALWFAANGDEAGAAAWLGIARASEDLLRGRSRQPGC
ncbi:MAG: hypothetical protein WCF16_09330 [Alphaproteobacteria bacterium]